MAWGHEKGADVKISALRACQYEIFDFVPCSLPLKTLILLTFSCFLIRRRGTALFFYSQALFNRPMSSSLPEPFSAEKGTKISRSVSSSVSRMRAIAGST